MMKISCYLLFLMFFLSACEDKLKFVPDTPVSKYVIEGSVANEAGSCRILVSQTQHFEDRNTFVGVSGAVVQIENRGSISQLSETVPGVYEDLKLKGIAGQTYRMIVKIDGKEFSANSTMPSVVPFSDFTLKPSDYNPARTTPIVHFKDPAGLKNYYWFQQFINGKVQREFKVVNDEIVDGGNIAEYLVFTNNTKDPSKNIVKGDKLTAEMHCVEAVIYTYLFGLSAADGSGEGLPAANPKSNISGGALGFFSAHTVQRKTIVVP